MLIGYVLYNNNSKQINLENFAVNRKFYPLFTAELSE